MTESRIEAIAKTLIPDAFSDAPTDLSYYACKPKGQSKAKSNEQWRDHNRTARKTARGLARKVIGLLDDLGHREIKDAARWRALLASNRIRWLGSAGFDHVPETTKAADRLGATARPDENLHFGMEVWSAYGGPEDQQGLQKGNCHGRSVLTAYADEIIRRATK